MHIGKYIAMVHESEVNLATAFRLVAKEHGEEPDVEETCELLATWSDELATEIQPFIKKYGQEKTNEPDRLLKGLFKKPRKGSLGLLRNLQDLWLMTNEGEVSAIVLRQAASGLRDKALIEVCNHIEQQSK